MMRAVCSVLHSDRTYESKMSAAATSLTLRGLLIALFFSAASVTCGNGANVLMSSLPGEGSHFFGAVEIGKALVSNGHSVTFILGNSHAHRAQEPAFSQRFKVVVFEQNVTEDVLRKRQSKYNNFAMRHGTMAELIGVIRDEGASDCDSLLNDLPTLQKLNNELFDVIVYDIAWPCAPLFSSKIGFVPYIALSMLPLPSSNVIFAEPEQNPSYVPVIGLGFSNDMTFFQRVGNTVFFHFLNTVFRAYFYHPLNELVNRHNIYSPTGNVFGLLQNTSLWLANVDFAVEYPCVLPPNVIPVGGLTTRPAKSLPPDLEEFLDSSGTSGVVICTTGTFVTSIPNDTVDIFATAFGRLPQKVIWQLSKPPSNALPNNVKILPWLPQNDLLGHPKTRALFFQGGNNGFYEAVYHGVPMVLLPILGDQNDVGTLAESINVGIKLDISSVTADTIVNALNDVINNNEYKRNIQKRSDVFRDRPLRPTERAAFWIEHVIKYGGDYFRSPAVKYSFIRNRLLDVYSFLLLTLCITMFIFIFVFKFFISRLRLLFTATNKSKQD